MEVIGAAGITGLVGVTVMGVTVIVDAPGIDSAGSAITIPTTFAADEATVTAVGADVDATFTGAPVLVLEVSAETA